MATSDGKKRYRPDWVWGYQGAPLPPGVKPTPPKGPAAWVPVNRRATRDSSADVPTK